MNKKINQLRKIICIINSLYKTAEADFPTSAVFWHFNLFYTRLLL